MTEETPSNTKKEEFDSVEMMRDIRTRLSETIRDMDYKTQKEYIKKQLGKC